MTFFARHLDYFKVVVCLLTITWANTVFAQGTLRPRGDVNCDWEVNIADANALIDSIFAGAKYHALYSYAADINGDKEINIADINAVIDAVMGGTLAPMPSYSGTLPALFINTNGHRNIDSKEEYIHADWWLDNMGVKDYQSIGTAQNPLTTQIKGRGNATWTRLDKKPYRLKLDKKQALLGMPANKNWVLLANAEYWMGQMNDVLPFEIGRRMGMAWNPRIEPVEVVLNGQYIGMYFLTEHIRVAVDRVNIEEQQNNETDSLKITGGWLLEIDNYKEPDNISFTEGDGKPFWVTPHSPDSLSTAQRDYITSFLKQTDAAVYNPSKSWEDFIDKDSLAIFYIVQEVVDNPEAFSGSCFMYKQRGDSTKLIFGPMWDFGSSFTRYSGSDNDFNEFIYNDLPDYCQSRWITQIAAHLSFQQCVKEHWKRFYNEIYPQMDAYLDAFAAHIEQAGNCDHKRWPQYNGNNTTLRMNLFCKPSFHKKVEWLNSQWSDSLPYDDPETGQHKE